MAKKTKPLPDDVIAVKASADDPRATEPTAPIRQVHAVERVDGGWIMVTLHYRENELGAEVVKIEKTVPDIKPMAIEKLKIASFKYWSGAK